MTKLILLLINFTSDFMNDDFLSNFNIPIKEEEVLTDSKRDVLRLLKELSIDTRYISYTSNIIYINNLRFSKFSRRREEVFNKHYPNIKVLRSSLFQKICSHSSKVLSKTISPQDRLLLPQTTGSIENLIKIVLEPYTRKYGVKLLEKKTGKYDKIVSPLTLNKEVILILDDIFSGNKINFNNLKEDTIYPFINVSEEWIYSFLNIDPIIYEESSSIKFMEFLEDIVPQYMENIVHSTLFLKDNIK